MDKSTETQEEYILLNKSSFFDILIQEMDFQSLFSKVKYKKIPRVH